MTTTAMLARYERATKFLQGAFTTKVARNDAIYPNWIEGTECFWYFRQKEKGGAYRLVDALAGTNEPAFDHDRLAILLAEATGEAVAPDNICLNALNVSEGAHVLTFEAFERKWRFDKKASTLEQVKKWPDNWVISPDGSKAVFTRDYNLWLRDLKTGGERPLTTDGEEHFCYGVNGAAWGISIPPFHIPQVRWSPDSRYLFTVQRDVRQVNDLPVVEHVPADGSVRPKVHNVKIAYPGDEHIETLRLLVIDMETGQQTGLQHPQVSIIRNSYGFFIANLGWWGKDSDKGYFVDMDRYYKKVQLNEFDPKTGKVRTLFEERAETHINLMQNSDMKPAYLPLPETEEILWYSDRSGWAHVYLYDLKTGERKTIVTQGDWLVREIVSFDADRREVWLQTGARTSGRNPYYRDLVRVNVDTGELQEVVSGDYDVFASAFNDMRMFLVAQRYGIPGHDGSIGSVSRSGNYAAITRSRVDTVPVSVLVDREGREVLEVETADLSLPEGWTWPEPVEAVAADGKTDIYGVVYRPSDYDPEKSYPVVSDIFNTPELAWVTAGSFGNDLFGGAPYYTAAAIAELGFIVVQFNGRGTPFRHKAFHDHNYGHIDRCGDIDDHVAGIRQLAEKDPSMDLNRVGVETLANGGQGVWQGLFRHPDFYKVGVNGCFHDARLIGATMWGNMYEGDNPSDCFPENEVEKLQGKYLLMHGMADPVTPPAGLFRLIEALRKANKDFDMIMLPNVSHDINSYMIRRGWDYLVEHLLGETPPKEFRIEAPNYFNGG